MRQQKRIADRSVVWTVLQAFKYKKTRHAAIRCLFTTLKNFFWVQYKAVLFPNHIPISQVDHPLDERIPFRPEMVYIYLDFVAFWVRTVGFLLEQYGKKGEEVITNFIDSMGSLYDFAGQVYQRNLSTTKRPRYFKNFRFILIQIFDPHLMCVPSLHVMVVVRTYTAFRNIVTSFGDTDNFKNYINELQDGAIKITESVLHVKQHSINCISAALYAMTRFDPYLCPLETVTEFIQKLFIQDEYIQEQDKKVIRQHILQLFSQFYHEGEQQEQWFIPIVEFLQERQCSYSAKNQS